MKKLFFILLTVVIALSCSSDDSSGPALSDTPQAKAEFDNSGFGIYKGVFVGSSGTILININNDGEVFAELIINGNSTTYTTTETIYEDSTINITFTNGSSSFDFYVDYTGYSPEVYNLSISGHPNANIFIVKEFSNTLVECFQGTFNGDDSGVFNLIVYNGSIRGLAKSNDSTESIFLYGSVTNNNLAGSFEGGGFIGSRNGNNISGDWENDFAESGGWSGRRKL